MPEAIVQMTAQLDLNTRYRLCQDFSCRCTVEIVHMVEHVSEK